MMSKQQQVQAMGWVVQEMSKPSQSSQAMGWMVQEMGKQQANSNHGLDVE